MAGLAIILLAVGVAFVPGAMRSPHAAAPAGTELTIFDTGKETPVVGNGPLERVLRIVRAPGGGTVGLEPFTGEKLATFDATDSKSFDDHEYAIQRFGYSAAAHRSLQLTFDDGPDPAVTRALLDELAREKVPATFFVMGEHVAANPDIIQRMAREGHAIGIHTMDHPQMAKVPAWRQQLELVLTERLIRTYAGENAQMWRMPYTGPDLALQRETISGLLHAQRQGYVHASYDFDTLDWEVDSNPAGKASDIPMPNFDSGENITVLMHDGGGDNRMRTVEYVKHLIAEARAHGYSFHTMPQVLPAAANANAAVSVTDYDLVSTAVVAAYYSWPGYLMSGLFGLALVIVLGLGAFNIVLAYRRRKARDAMTWPAVADMNASASVVLAAYNEEGVIARTLHSVLASEYPIHELIVVDDGSSDATAARVREVARRDARVLLITQPNGGKSSAMNNGVAAASGDVIVTLDADTILTPDSITNLVRHFAVPGAERLGAVAGVVAVGNRTKNLMTRWQALEYLTMIGLERSSQDALGAINIVPGACAAWRREAIVEAGGYSTDTLAEDCDLALTLHQLGWRITQDDDAYAYTEVPETLDALLKQRERWTYGTLQAMHKHRRMMFNRRFGALGWYVMPNFLLSVAIPLVFLPFVAVITFQTAAGGGLLILAAYWVMFCLIHLGLAAASVGLMREDWSHLKMVPFYRLVNDPLRAYLLYKSVVLAIKGGTMGWNKLARTGSMDAAHDSRLFARGTKGATA